MMVPEINLATIAPVLCLLGAVAAILGLELAFRREWIRSKLDWIAYVGLAGGFGFLLMGRGTGEGMWGSVASDDLSRFVGIAILTATALGVMQAPDYLVARGVYRAEYFSLVLFAAVGMLLLVQAKELITVFLSIELLSISIYILTGITRRDPRSTEAAVKYLVQGAFATGFLLYGMALVYGATGTLYLERMAIGSGSGDTLALAGILLMTAGFAFKVGAAPFHFWVPDAYEGAPTIVTSFMSVAVKAAGFGALVRLFAGPFGGAGEHWGAWMWALAVLTMIVGNLAAIAQQSVKRMLAYSSIAHTGYALVGLAAAAGSGLSDAARGAAFSSALLYMFFYTFMTLGAFAFLAWMGRPPSPAHPHGRDAEQLSDFVGLARRRPWAALMMTVFMVSLAGIPPTAGFFGKFILFKAAIGAQAWGLAIAGIATSAVSLYYYLRVVVAMYMQDPEEAGGPERGEGVPDFNAGVVVTFCAALTLLLGVIPGRFIEYARVAAEMIPRTWR